MLHLLYSGILSPSIKVFWTHNVHSLLFSSCSLLNVFSMNHVIVKIIMTILSSFFLNFCVSGSLMKKENKPEKTWRVWRKLWYVFFLFVRGFCIWSSDSSAKFLCFTHQAKELQTLNNLRKVFIQDINTRVKNVRKPIISPSDQFLQKLIPLVFSCLLSAQAWEY